MAGHMEPFGGCIRFYNGGPEWHINDGHVNVGFDTTRQPEILEGGDLVIYMNEPVPVVTCYSNCDETLTVNGFKAGPSGGVGHMTVRFRHETQTPGDRKKFDISLPANYALLKGNYANLWVGGERWIEED